MRFINKWPGAAHHRISLGTLLRSLFRATRLSSLLLPVKDFIFALSRRWSCWFSAISFASCSLLINFTKTVLGCATNRLGPHILLVLISIRLASSTLRVLSITLMLFFFINLRYTILWFLGLFIGLVVLCWGWISGLFDRLEDFGFFLLLYRLFFDKIRHVISLRSHRWSAWLKTCLWVWRDKILLSKWLKATIFTLNLCWVQLVQKWFLWA